jgi:hypothetical protein
MSNALELNTVNEAERFVTRQKNLGNDVRWENYDIVFFRADPRGITSTDGAFRSGTWGFENRSPLMPEGTWRIDWRNDKRNPKRARN